MITTAKQLFAVELAKATAAKAAEEAARLDDRGRAGSRGQERHQSDAFVEVMQRVDGLAVAQKEVDEELAQLERRADQRREPTLRGADLGPRPSAGSGTRAGGRSDQVRVRSLLRPDLFTWRPPEAPGAACPADGERES